MYKKLTVFILFIFLSAPCFAQEMTRRTPPSRDAYSPRNPDTVRHIPTPSPTAEAVSTPSQKVEEAKKSDSADKSKSAEDGKIKIPFGDGDIKQLIKEFSEILGMNFTYDDTVKGQVSLIGPKEVTKWEARQVFENALEMMGYTVIWGWPINKIVPVARAKTQGNVKVVY